MTTVQVILSSYNGEKYIREQLESILAQKGVEIRLLIRDDGSTDGTRSILSEYEQRFRNITVIYGTNVGVIQSFFLLLEQAGDYPYLAFADQDDVWLEQKLKQAMDKITKKEKEIVGPIVYCSAKQLVDDALCPLPSPITYPKVRTAFGNALVENMCTGCTCVINREMVQLLRGRIPKFAVMHDFWIYLVGTCFGSVIYDEESYILYRQHGTNKLGAATSLWENYKRRMKNFKKNRGQLTRQAEELWNLYQKIMPEEHRKLTEEFVQSKKHWKLRKKLVQERTIFRQRKSDDCIMKLLFFCGLL